MEISKFEGEGRKYWQRFSFNSAPSVVQQNWNKLIFSICQILIAGLKPRPTAYTASAVSTKINLDQIQMVQKHV